MLTLNAHFDGKTIVPDEPVSLPANQKLRVTIEPINAAAPQPGKKRVFGQQKGAVLHVASDFDDYLGDDFWGISDESQK